MNDIRNKPIASLGYGFIEKKYIPRGKNEYYLRNIQNRSGIRYRKLSAAEIKTLEKNGNMSADWQQVLVAEAFDPKLVRNCSFFGLVRIGKLEPRFHEYNNLRMPVGIYNSVIVSSDIGNNVVIDHVNYMSHYIVGDDVMLVNINELATTDHSKFGNGVLKEGENEQVRTWMEICNENGGRSVLPFNGMQTGDAWLWSKYRDDEKLMKKFKEFTDRRFDTKRGYYGKIGDRTVIKHTRIIKDAWIGSDAYIKGANKLKNLTINSEPGARTQIGEGCELVNGIIGFGCRIFYGVKAVRFVLGSNSQLKYGARLINSFLGENSTISCCEVLNSLIFPAHEQHHNNSFLCASTLFGQSNMAAGATIGSNHNSRGADGEIIAGRGFWPGLCVSLKHNSKFASFIIIAKGDYPAELHIPLPFSLVNNDVTHDKLVVMPGYWFLYNMYALARNVTKYESRDKRTEKKQVFEYDFLAPDSVNEMFDALAKMEMLAAEAYAKASRKSLTGHQLAKTGRDLLQNRPGEAEGLEILAPGFENSNRKVQLVKVPEACRVFRELIIYYGITELMRYMEENHIRHWDSLQKKLPKKPVRQPWRNIGAQLMPATQVQALIRNIRSGTINSWEEIHAFYEKKSADYHTEKFRHAFASLLEIRGLSRSGFSKKILVQLIREAMATRAWMTQNIYASRAKDYQNPFRAMVYDNDKEMDKVIGSLADNQFIRQQREETAAWIKKAEVMILNLG